MVEYADGTLNTKAEKNTQKHDRRTFLKRTAVVSSSILASGSGVPVLTGCSQGEQRLNKLRNILVNEMGRDASLHLFDSIRLHYLELNRRKPHYTKWGMRFNIDNAVLALAIYRALRENNCTRDSSIEKAGRLVWATMPLWLFEKVFRCIGHFPDPFAAFAWFTRRQVTVMFPEPGWKRNFLETNDCFGFDVTRCLYVDFLSKESTPELVIAMCDLDYRTAELYPPDFYFKRTMCLAKGNPLCDFRYYRRKG